MLKLLLQVLFDLYFTADTLSYLLLILLVTQLVHAEEKSVWENATVLDTQFGWYTAVPLSPKDSLIHGTFKELVHTLL